MSPQIKLGFVGNIAGFTNKGFIFITRFVGFHVVHQRLFELHRFSTLKRINSSILDVDLVYLIQSILIQDKNSSYIGRIIALNAYLLNSLKKIWSEYCSSISEQLKPVFQYKITF